MNFLQLVQRVHRKCRPSGSEPTTTTGALPAEPQRLVDWTNEAWMEIQNERADWDWMRKPVSFLTVNGQPSYTLAQMGVTDFGNWSRDSFRVYNTVGGRNSEIFLDYVPYEWWRDTYQFSGFRDARTMPVQFTWLPNFSIGLGPTPTGDYTITGDYFSVATEMVGNDAVPGIPEQWQMAIVYRAAMFYGASEAASEVYQDADANFKRIMSRVRRRDLPEFSFAGALA